MIDGRDEAVVGAGETPGGSPWRLTVRLQGAQRAIDLQVGPRGGGVEGPPPLSNGQLIDFCMIGGLEEQYIVGQLTPAVERVRIRLDDDSQVDATIVRSDFGNVDYFVAFAPWEREVIEATAFDGLGQVLALRQRSNIESWREWRLRKTKPGP